MCDRDYISYFINKYDNEGIYLVSLDKLQSIKEQRLANSSSILIYDCDTNIKSLLDYVKQHYGNSRIILAYVKKDYTIHEGNYNVVDISSIPDITAVFVEGKNFYSRSNYDFSDFIDIIDVLRGPNGCPWDRAQTHQSLRKHIVEESYETVSAINNGDVDNLCEELGDVLLQIILHSNIASENKEFTISDVINMVSQKMIHRHAHIFGDKTANSPEEVKKLWEEIKAQDKGYQSASEVLNSISTGLPTLVYASKLQSKARKYGFDFECIEDTFAKINEEMLEFKHELYKNPKNESDIENELGDVLFSVVNMARFADVDPDLALRRASEKFKNRFHIMEKLIKNDNKCLKDLTLEQIDVYWNSSKNHVK